MTSAAVRGPRRTPLEPWIMRRAGVADVAGLRRHQARALRDVVARARAHSRFYGERLAGVEPGDIISVEDVVRLPFTSADDIRREGMRLLCVRPGEVDRIVSLPTSGTTGPPKRIQFTTADQDLTVDFFGYGMTTLVEPGDRVLILLPGERPGSVGDLLRRGLAREGIDGVVRGPVRDADEALSALDALARGGFDAVVGIPVQILGLARRGLAEGREIRLRSVLLSTDHASPSLVAAVEAAWGCEVFDHYGMTEMGLGGGVECEAHAGYHLREADLLFEVVDPDSGAPVPDGAYGEVVFTTLSREAMPLIRYRTGDRSRFVPTACPCGSWLRSLERVRTRLTDRVTLGSGGTLDLAALDDALLGLPEVTDLRATLCRDGAAETLAVEILGAGGAGEGGEALQRSAALALTALAPVSEAVRAGRLAVEVTVAAGPWAGSDGTAKRTFRRSGIAEGRV